MKVELKRPWERHNCNTIHFLMATKEKYPTLINSAFLEQSIKTTEILTPLSYKHLGRIFWGSTSLSAITHPAYDALSTFLQSVKSKQLVNFWIVEVNETLAAPNKIKEVVTLKMLTDFLSQGTLSPKTINKLLTARFIKMIFSSLKNLRQQKHDVLLTFYDEFFAALNLYFDKLTNDGEDDSEKVEIIKKFILHPGQLLLEKYLSHKVVHQLITKLNKAGVTQMFDLYKQIFLGQLTKNPNDSAMAWMNIEKQHCAQMMQYIIGQKCIQQDIDWRIEQLKFLLNVSLFYTSDTGEPVRKDQDNGHVTKDLWQNIKNIFYSSLQMKMSNLKDEKRLLFALVTYCNEILTKKNSGKFLKEPLPDKAMKSWKTMFATVSTATKGTNKKDKKLTTMFHILFLHMGLQLFREAEMAELAIADLERCMENTEKKKKQTVDEGMEPDWIEVVTDLFLHLLSQNTSFLRSVVNNVFPHICPNMTLTAVHQILSVLDMKDGKNPLTNGIENGAEEEASSEEEDEESEPEEKDDEDEEDDDNEKEEDDSVIEEDEGIFCLLNNLFIFGAYLINFVFCFRHCIRSITQCRNNSFG